jgi:hypothetical protein
LYQAESLEIEQNQREELVGDALSLRNVADRERLIGAGFSEGKQGFQSITGALR